MNAWDELVMRCALERREKIGPLSDQAFNELLLAVRENPTSFVDSPADEAFLKVTKALDAYKQSTRDDDLLDDDEYLEARSKRLAQLRSSAARAASIDEGCLDARLLEVLTQELDPDPLLTELLNLEREFDERAAAQAGETNVASGPAPDVRHLQIAIAGTGPAEASAEPAANASSSAGAPADLWNDVFARPRLRLRAAVSRTCLESGRARMAADAAASVVDVSPSDPLGTRHTWALALARLEDEPSFYELDARFGRRGDSWSHLARVLLLYKLDRINAARRALHGFDELCEGGAYALLKPSYVEIYLPDRPNVETNSFEESILAVREAEPIIADVPEFINWCQSQRWLFMSARSFAQNNDLDW